MAQKYLYYLSLDLTHWLLAIILIFTLAPFERMFPRVVMSAARMQTAKPKIAAVIIIAICSYGMVWLFNGYFYSYFISAFVKLQLFSIAKSDFSLPIIYCFSFLFVDFLIYVFHFLSHKLSFLWKLHSIHHADEHVNAKTGVLHHPFETLASLLFVLFFAVILGIPIIVMILYAVFATIFNFFVHANIALPSALDAALRNVIVTPDMHRTHHSVEHHEGNSNFGQVFTFWDRLFGTYINHPASGEENLIMGLPTDERPKGFNATQLLLHPIAKIIERVGRIRSNP